MTYPTLSHFAGTEREGGILEEHRQGREPPLCWHEVAQLAMNGHFPNDYCLEGVLDRMELTS